MLLTLSVVGDTTGISCAWPISYKSLLPFELPVLGRSSSILLLHCTEDLSSKDLVITSIMVLNGSGISFYSIKNTRFLYQDTINVHHIKCNQQHI